jgi:hypothetical protein
MASFTTDDRELFRSATRAVNEVQAAGTAGAKSYRNVLIVVVLVLAVVAVVIPTMLARTDGRLLDLKIGSAQGGGQTALGYAQVASIELWGVLGALVGAVAGLRNLRGSTQPIGLQLAQIALKIPTGALTALVGVVLLQAALTPTTQAVSADKIAAVAVVFGIAQEGLTAFVDRTAGQLLDRGRSAGDKSASV